MPSGDGDACYFPRDLGRGSYGGDVHCLQLFLSRKGYLNEEPTGYFGDRTAIATKRWQVRARTETIQTRAVATRGAKTMGARGRSRAHTPPSPRVARMSPHALVAPVRRASLFFRGVSKKKLTRRSFARRDNGVDSVDGHLELASRDKYAALRGYRSPARGGSRRTRARTRINTSPDVSAPTPGSRDRRRGARGSSGTKSTRAARRARRRSGARATARSPRPARAGPPTSKYASAT